MRNAQASLELPKREIHMSVNVTILVCLLLHSRLQLRVISKLSDSWKFQTIGVHLFWYSRQHRFNDRLI